jgi:Luciferase-like monooxygenase
VIYREPALLAKAVTTLDVLSGGRVGLGVGAAWNADESRGLGFDFPPTAERFEKLEEAIRICLQMWSGSQEPFDGKHYQLGRTLNSPQSLARPHPYLMVGGSGEKKTLRLVAQYADAVGRGRLHRRLRLRPRHHRSRPHHRPVRRGQQPARLARYGGFARARESGVRRSSAWSTPGSVTPA